MSKENKKARKEDADELPEPWNHIQGAVWLIGLAILFWKGWWWPGILVLAAISGLVQAGIQLYLSRQDEGKQVIQQEKQIEQERSNWLPDVCPNCGGPLSVSTVKWTGLNTADCPYCKANLKKP